MQQATTARAFLRRLHPWLGRAVHVRWRIRRSVYQSEIDRILLALAGKHGRMSPEMSLRVQGLIGRLYREWFPPAWRRDPTYAEMLSDFRWWLGMAERWSEAPPKPRRVRRPSEPLTEQPKRLLRMLGLPPRCTETTSASAGWPTGFATRPA